MNLFFEEKRIIKKIIIALVIILMLNFIIGNCGSMVVFSVENGEDISDDTEEEAIFGGALLLPIQSFILFITDGALQLLQNSFITPEDITIRATSEETSSVSFVDILLIVGAVAVVAIACVDTFGAGAAVLGAGAGAASFGAGVASVTAAAAASRWNHCWGSYYYWNINTCSNLGNKRFNKWTKRRI